MFTYNKYWFLAIFLVMLACDDVTDAVISTDDLTVEIDENPNTGAVIGTVTGSINGGNVSFSIVSQNPAGALAINSTSGELTVVDSTLFDYEVRTTLTAMVNVSSGDLSKTANVTINLQDVDEDTPVISTEDLTVEIDENPNTGAVIGTVTGSINGGNVSFSIVSQNPEGALAINSTSGELTVVDSTLFDYEVRTTLTAMVNVSSGDLSKTANVTINLKDVDEDTPPQFTIWEGAKITFTKADDADPTLEVNQDRITDAVWLTRDNSEGGQLYNIVSETVADKDNSPKDTEWSLGTTSQISSLTFTTFRAADPDNKPKNLVDKDMVLHLISDDIYIDIKITSWSTGKTGGFSYERSTEN